MRRTEQVQGLRLMKFEEVYGRTHRGGEPGGGGGGSGCLGTFRRWRDRYEAEGADGLYDRRLGRVSARRAPVDEVARVLELFDTRWDLTAKHFHEKLRGRSRLQAQLQLAAAELASPWAQARGAHAWGAPAQAAAPRPARHDAASGRLEPRVGPRSMVGPDRHHGRCDQRYLLGLLRRRRGHHVELPGGVRGDPGQGPVLLALRRPRQPLLEHARGRRQGGQGHPDPGRPRPGAARHRVDPGLLARGKAHSAPCRSACPRNSGSPASPTWPGPTASSRRSSCHNTTPASRPRPRTRAPPSSPSPARSTTSCVHCLKRQHGALPGTSDPRRPPPPYSRPGFHECTMAVFLDRDVWRYHASRQPKLPA